MTNVPTTPVKLANNRAEPQNVAWSRLRRLALPVTTPDAESAATGVVNAQVWIDQAVWRPAGFWAFVAGLLAAGALRQGVDLNWQALALLALLVDPLWSSIWRLSGGRQALLALPRLRNERTLSLPYLQAGSPAARLLAGDHTDVWPAALRVGLPAVVLALLVAALLGGYAIGVTMLVVVLAALGWTLRRTFGHSTPLLQSVVAIGLPWLLTVQQVRWGQSEIEWLPQLLLALLWVIHQWGGLRSQELLLRKDWLGLAALGAAQAGICLLLVVAQSPLWLAPLAVLFLPTWLVVHQGLPLRRMRVVWLAAMLVSALALGQTVGV